MRTELSPSAYHIDRTKEEISLEWKRETPAFILLSLFVSLLILGHVIYGTVLLSSVLLVSPSDSVPIVCRYVLSIVVCRGILIFELAGVKEAIERGTHPAVEQTDTEQGDQIQRSVIVKAGTT
jgi:hypothetical protein